MVIICITFTLSMFYLSTKAVIYILNKRDVEGFAESILERSVLLMEQIEFVFRMKVCFERRTEHTI